MIVYAFDERFMPISKRKLINWEALKARHNRDGTVYAGVEIQAADVPLTIVLRIKLAVREKGQGMGSIWSLRLCAHGYCGNLQLGTGLRWHQTAASVGGFEELASYMTPGGPGVEIWGCGIGSETDIRELGLDPSVPSGRRTQSGKPEFRPGSYPKPFVRQSDWEKYYQRGPDGPFGKVGGLVAPGEQPPPPKVNPSSAQSTISLLCALSHALKGCPVTAAIHAQYENMVGLDGPTVTVSQSERETVLKLNVGPPGRAKTSGPLGP